MNLFDLMARISLDSKDYEQGLSDASRQTQTFGSRMSSALSTASKVGLAALTAAKAGVIALMKQAVTSFGEYEQLVGGVETLFGDAAQQVLQNAQNAYKTAGVSANEYMATVTSFAASLRQSTKSEAEAAAIADMAVQDMADNANKMGTDMGSIQVAYQGFAKQNYTMLDNLKLGYGGTKSEMERLLKDAQKITGVKYDINNLSDVYEAIHVIQGELGITGTTAKEAGETIQGSMAAAKASFQNLLIAMVSGEGIDSAIDNLADSVTTAVKNLLPAISKGLKGLSKVIKKLAPVISKALPPLLKEVLPSLLDAATSLIGALFEALPGIISASIESIGTAVHTLWRSFVNSITGGVSGNTELWYSLTKIGENIRTAFSSIWDAIKSFTSGEISFSDMISKIKTAVSDFTTSITNWLSSLDWSSIWSTMWDAITNVAKWIGDAVVSFDGLLANLADGLVTWVTGTVLPWISSLDWGAIWKLMWDGITSVAKWIGDKAISFAGLLSKLVNGVITWVTEEILPWISGLDWGAIWGKFWASLRNVGDWIYDKTLSLVGILGSIAGNIATWVTGTVIPWLQSLDWGTMWNAFWAGLADTQKWLKDKALSLIAVFDRIWHSITLWFNTELLPYFENMDWHALWDTFWEKITDIETYLSDATFDLGYIVGQFAKSLLGLADAIVRQFGISLTGVSGRVIDAMNDSLIPGEGEGITAMDFLSKIGLTLQWFLSIPEKFLNGIISAFTGKEFNLSDALAQLVVKGVDAVSDFWAWVLGEDGETGIGWFTKTAQDFVDKLGLGFGQAVANVTEWFTNLWDSIKEYFVGDGSEENGGILGKIVGFVTGGFQTSWENAWNGVVEGFGNIFSGVVNLVRSPINSVIEFINSMIDAIENGINTVIGGINSALSIHSEGFWVGWPIYNRVAQFDWSIDIPTVEWGRIDPIPELAKGGILSSGDAIFAEAGPELLSMKHGRAHVQPLSSSARTAALGNDEVLALLKQYLPQLANMQVVLDDGTLVGAMDRGLGQRIVWGARYNA